MVTRVGKFLGGLDADVTDVLKVHTTENMICLGADSTPAANLAVVGNAFISTNLVVNQGLGAVGNTAPAVTDVSLGTPANVVIRTHAASGAGNVIVGDATATSAFNLDVHGTANVGALTSTGITADVTGDVTGTSSIATAVTCADESADTTCFPTFVTAATGDLPPKTGTNLTFNSSSGLLTATLFAGDISGDLTGAVLTASQGAITTVGALDGGSITSGFGTIDTGSSAITSTGAISGGSFVVADDGTIGSTTDTDAIDISAAGVVGLSATTEASATGTAALTVAGGIGVAKDMWIGDDIVMDSDLAAIKMGDAQAVSLTHVADTGVALNLGLGLAGNTAPIATALSMGTPANVVIRTFAATGIANVIVGDATATSGYNLDVRGTANTGALTASGLAYPTADGTEDYVLSTDGAGALSWVAQSGGGAVNPATALASNIDSGNFDDETSDAFGIIITDNVIELDCGLYAADALGTVDLGSVA